MQLKIIILLLFSFLKLNSYSQQVEKDTNLLKVINGNEIYNALYDSINIKIDSLEKYNSKGILFFNIKLDKERISNIKCSDEEPLLLIQIITTTLKDKYLILDKNKYNDANMFVLPILYDFYHPPIHGQEKLSDLLAKIPKVDVTNNFTVKEPKKFNSLFEIQTTSLDTYGIKCIFLPWLFIKGKIQ